MERTRLVNAGLATKGLVVAGACTLIGILVTASESYPAFSMPLRIALTLGCLLAVALLPVSLRKWHTLALWASIGATMGFGLGGLFGIGPIGIVPFVFVITYAVLMRHELDYDLSLTTGALSAMLFVLVTIPIQQFT